MKVPLLLIFSPFLLLLAIMCPAQDEKPTFHRVPLPRGGWGGLAGVQDAQGYMWVAQTGVHNAFYAVNEKKKQLNGTFEPTVEVSTKRVGNKVELSVKDNGTGIPQKVLDKIYQPFFTTKPTGQGTGLGLSLSYDIIKAHGGNLKVETKEGEGAKFLITLSAESPNPNAAHP